jgi:uncharacterized phosphatase
VKLLVVRHGECEANLRGVVAGSRDDSPLTPKGIADAEAVGRLLKGTDIDVIVTSPLQRARRTADIIRDLVFPDLKIEIDSDFTEFDVGDATGMPLDEYFAMAESGKPIPNAEPLPAIYERVQRGLNQLRKHQDTVLLVAHTGTIRMMECVLSGLKPSDISSIAPLNNGEIKHFELN